MPKLSKSTPPAVGKWREAGASLLEVLIAVLILAIGLLGIAALQAVTLRNVQSSSDRTAAVIQTYSMLDMMRANRLAALAGSYDTAGYICEAPTGTALVARDTARWITQMQQAMGPTACGAIRCEAGGCEVQVRWNDSRATGSVEQYEITTETDL